jgi:hypothetical protein
MCQQPFVSNKEWFSLESAGKIELDIDKSQQELREGSLERFQQLQTRERAVRGAL